MGGHVDVAVWTGQSISVLTMIQDGQEAAARVNERQDADPITEQSTAQTTSVPVNIMVSWSLPSSKRSVSSVARS